MSGKGKKPSQVKDLRSIYKNYRNSKAGRSFIFGFRF